jgi:hypothetical protein
MSAGANFVLDKGFKLDNAGAAQTIYRFMKMAASENAVLQQTAGTIFSVGVCQDRIDAADSATGNAQVNVRMMGITKIELAAGTTLVAGVTRIASNATGQGVVAAGATTVQCGIALTNITSSAAGALVDMLILPQSPALA